MKSLHLLFILCAAITYGVWKPLSLSAAPKQLLQNSGFEQEEGWRGANFVYQIGAGANGSRALVLASNSTSYVQQSVIISPDVDSATVRFTWRNVRHNSDPALQLKILSADGTQLIGQSPAYQADGPYWQEVELSISNLLGDMRGKEVQVLLQTTQQMPGSTTQFIIDNVTLNVAGSSTQITYGPLYLPLLTR